MSQCWREIHNLIGELYRQALYDEQVVGFEASAAARVFNGIPEFINSPVRVEVYGSLADLWEQL